VPETIPLKATLQSDLRRILYDWNDTRVEFPDACVHELFEQQVARDPEAIAVVYKDRRLTYRELNQRANQVAHYLQKRGVGPEILAGVCLERSPEMVIALLGVWKAGGAYVPLDPAYPRERLSFMASDAGLKVLLTNETCRRLFASARGMAAICLDSDWPAIARESAGDPGRAAVPTNLAYVIYTSGSTGQPKGAMIQHDGLVNYLCWAIKAHAVEGKTCIPVHTSISFDVAAMSLYPPLLTGGQIELLPEDLAGQSVLMALRQMKNSSNVVLTPSHLELLNLLLSPDEMEGMTNVLVIAGEKLIAVRLSPWRRFAPATRLINEYGPTEASVACTAYEVQAQDPRNGSVPIGRPIANMQVYVLGPTMEPVLPGRIGELFIGGVGVARGYLNRPELTRERFLPDPFSGRSGARLYKTGDLGRYRQDGTLEFLGRLDDQVKVRGHRVELGEIEAILAGYPGVRSCKVLAREDPSGNNQLVSYIIGEEKNSLEAGGLRNYLRQRLPEHMVPAHFVLLDSFPLTQNGKIDRKALPAPSSENILASRDFVAPRTETEKKLAAIWKDLLKVERIGIHDDFFDLGGDSLLAVMATLQIQEVFGVTPSMQAFFPSATIADLAETLTDCDEHPDRWAYSVPVQSKGEELPFFWIGAAARTSPLSGLLGSNQPFIGICIEPAIVYRLKAPYRMEEITKHLVLALQEQQPHGPYRLGGYCQDGVFAFDVARQLAAQGEGVELLALFEAENPSPEVKTRIVTELKRAFIRMAFQFNQAYRLKTSELPLYFAERRKQLNRFLDRLAWRVSSCLRSFGIQFRRPDFGQILFLVERSYKPKPVSCPTIIFRCKDWPTISAGDPYLGWRSILLGPCETYEVPGDHGGIFTEGSARVVARKLKDLLQKSAPSVRPPAD